jgi:hypothetical protein
MPVGTRDVPQASHVALTGPQGAFGRDRYRTPPGRVEAGDLHTTRRCFPAVVGLQGRRAG